MIDTLQNAMYDDSKADSHPILVEVESPGQTNEIFDSISYSKVSYIGIFKSVCDRHFTECNV